MELCSMTLSDYMTESAIAALHEDPGKMWLARMQSVWMIMSQIVSGLDFLHEHDKVHRDLKPQNGKLSKVP
jgi:serine/threonine protein kinase